MNFRAILQPRATGSLAVQWLGFGHIEFIHSYPQLNVLGQWPGHRQFSGWALVAPSRKRKG